jgi:hypothetical protein
MTESGKRKIPSPLYGKYLNQRQLLAAAAIKAGAARPLPSVDPRYAYVPHDAVLWEKKPKILLLEHCYEKSVDGLAALCKYLERDHLHKCFNPLVAVENDAMRLVHDFGDRYDRCAAHIAWGKKQLTIVCDNAWKLSGKNALLVALSSGDETSLTRFAETADALRKRGIKARYGISLCGMGQLEDIAFAKYDYRYSSSDAILRNSMIICTLLNDRVLNRAYMQDTKR